MLRSEKNEQGKSGTLTEAGVLALIGGDSVEVKVLHEAAGNGDCATDAYFRAVTSECV